MLLLSAVLSEGSIVDLDATFFVQFALFAVAFFVLNSLIFQPMLRLFEAREQRIDGAKLEARQLEQGAQEKGEAFEQEMARMRQGAADERDKIRAEAKRMESEILDRVRADTAAELAASQRDLDKEAAALRSAMNAQTAVLAKQIASKLLHREVN